MTLKQRAALRKATSLTLFLVPATLLLMNAGGSSSKPGPSELPPPQITIEILGPQWLDSDHASFASDVAFDLDLDLDLAFLGESDAPEAEEAGSDGPETFAGPVFSADGKEVLPVDGKEVWPFEKDVLAPENLYGIAPQPTLGIPRLRPPFRSSRRANRDTDSAARPSNVARPALVPIPEPGAFFSAALCLGLLSLRRGVARGRPRPVSAGQPGRAR